MTPAQLRAFRDRHALTQADLAELVGMSPLSVQGWEAGRRKVPSPVAIILELVDDQFVTVHDLDTVAWRVRRRKRSLKT